MRSTEVNKFLYITVRMILLIQGYDYIHALLESVEFDDNFQQKKRACSCTGYRSIEQLKVSLKT